MNEFFRCVRCGCDRGGVIDLTAKKPQLICFGCHAGTVSVSVHRVNSATGTMVAGFATPSAPIIRPRS